MTRDQRLIALFAAVVMITGGTLGASVIGAGPPVPVVSRDVPVGPDGRLSLRIFGDTMLGGEFPLLAAQRGQSYDWAFDALRPSLTEADYVVTVAEAPFTDLTEPWNSSRATSFFTSTPPVAGALSRAGVDALMLATDHSFDTGPDGLADTMVHVEAAGIATIGGGPDLPRAEQPLLLPTELGTIAVVGFGESFGHRARNDTAGTMVMSPEAVQRGADLARAAGADWVIAAPHWGNSYARSSRSNATGPRSSPTPATTSSSAAGHTSSSPSSSSVRCRWRTASATSSTGPTAGTSSWEYRATDFRWTSS